MTDWKRMQNSAQIDLALQFYCCTLHAINDAHLNTMNTMNRNS